MEIDNTGNIMPFSLDNKVRQAQLLLTYIIVIIVTLYARKGSGTHRALSWAHYMLYLCIIEIFGGINFLPTLGF